MNLIIEIIFLLIVLLIIILNFLIRIGAKTLQEIPNKTELSGFEIARNLCDCDPHIIKKNGKFQDYYHRERNVIKLSPEVFDGTDMYAALISTHLSLETKNKNDFFMKIPSLLVILSYIIICISACLNNIDAIHLGLIIFIIAFILELIIINQYGMDDKEINELLTKLEKDKMINPTKELKTYFALYNLIIISKLPYSFINYFK